MAQTNHLNNPASKSGLEELFKEEWLDSVRLIKYNRNSQ